MLININSVRLHFLVFNTGIPTIHDKAWPVQPDYNGSFSYGTLVNNDSVAPTALAVATQDMCISPSTSPPSQEDELKKD